MQEAKGRTNKQKTKQAQPQSTNKQTTKTKTTATTQLPFAAGETGETGETETTPSKKLVQHCYERQAFFTREDGITLTYREHSRVKGRFRKTTKQTKPQNNTRTRTPPKRTQTKKPQQNKPKQQNQPFTLVRRRAQVARARLEQSNKLTRMHRHALRL